MVTQNIRKIYYGNSRYNITHINIDPSLTPLSQPSYYKFLLPTTYVSLPLSFFPFLLTEFDQLLPIYREVKAS